MNRISGAVVVLTSILSMELAGGQKPIQQQVQEAVNPLSRSDRAGATVMGYRGGPDTLEVIREGTNNFVCLADKPGTDRFMVSCYHKSLEPFMARGRELRAQGLSREEVRERRDRELAEGVLTIAPAALISLIGRINPETGHPDSVSTLRVLYMPNATLEETGLSKSGRGGSAWLMEPGTPHAHLMIPGERRPFRRSRRRSDDRWERGHNR